MTNSTANDAWAAGPSYEYYMGRWSRLIASVFLNWLAPRPGLNWLEIGCGTGALSETILAQGAPAILYAIDPSPDFVGFARRKLPDPRVVFQIGDALDLPAFPQKIDVVASGLALNFIQDPSTALKAMRHSLSPHGILAFYVWDYGGKMEMLSYFWESVKALDPDARSQDEGLRFPICQPDALAQLCEQAGLHNIEITGLEATMQFPDFNDFWSPFLGGAGPAPAYVARLDESRRKALEDHLRTSLPIRADGALHLAARSWAVRATP
jgi:SAM-dependent methyltransferase